MNGVGCDHCCAIPLGPGPECMCECHDTCHGRTVAGTPCELPAGHYPATHHQITYDGGAGWMMWTDESMAEFARIADEMGER